MPKERKCTISLGANKTAHDLAIDRLKKKATPEEQKTLMEVVARHKKRHRSN
jgi:hypothetical protein